MNYITLYIFITFLFACFFNVNKRDNRLVLVLLFLALVNELITMILIQRNCSYLINTTLYLLVHNVVWLSILFRYSVSKNVILIGIVGYVLYSAVNYLFIEGSTTFNYTSFILGAFLYLVFFIIESFYQLEKENFAFFQSNTYLLLLSPVLFYFGLSFIFGFKSSALASTVVFGTVPLYDFIGYFVNFVYYTLIIIYIYKEKKEVNGTV